VPPYFADELSRSADSQAQCSLRSASSSSLVVRCTRLSTVCDLSFPIAASHVRNGLPQYVRLSQYFVRRRGIDEVPSICAMTALISRDVRSINY